MSIFHKSKSQPTYKPMYRYVQEKSIIHHSPFCGDITIVPSFWMVNSLHFNDLVARQNFRQRLLDAYVLSHDGHGPLGRPVGSGVFGVISWGKTECHLAPLRIQGLLLNYQGFSTWYHLSILFLQKLIRKVASGLKAGFLRFQMMIWMIWKGFLKPSWFKNHHLDMQNCLETLYKAAPQKLTPMSVRKIRISSIFQLIPRRYMAIAMVLTTRENPIVFGPAFWSSHRVSTAEVQSSAQGHGDGQCFKAPCCWRRGGGFHCRISPFRMSISTKLHGGVPHFIDGS